MKDHLMFLRENTSTGGTEPSDQQEWGPSFRGPSSESEGCAPMSITTYNKFLKETSLHQLLPILPNYYQILPILPTCEIFTRRRHGMADSRVIWLFYSI